ncbi:hypothetical protein TWF718_005249 [Orbilia javanica]|uniref:Uncharacterized protein n=1 Tax=Orbilia javanica TaxID=47235 RepID=A0AAN8RJ96_9PEZI
MEEKFVFLAITKEDIDPLRLNLMEMWCCLMLQTLTRNALQAYLPPGSHLSPNAGGHLNIALPLHQSYQGNPVQDNLMFHNIQNYSDPLRKSYYASLRQNFYSLKHSPNPVVREFYKQKMAAAQRVRAQTSRQRSADVSRSGRDVKVLRNGRRQAFSISHWIFSVSRKVAHLDSGAILHVECDLLDPATRHPHCYATNSEASDPAGRLGIRITGTDAYGDSINIWVQSTGTREVFKMNTFVDMLEGLNIQEPEDRERRWVPPARAIGKKATYTSDIVHLFSQRN